MHFIRGPSALTCVKNLGGLGMMVTGVTEGREQVKNHLRSSRPELIKEITKLRLFYFFLDDENSVCFTEPRSTPTIM